MNAPLTRDEQIALMVNAEKRIEGRVAAWLSVRQIREAVKRKMSHDLDTYEEQSTKIKRCG
jgi:hypothetical protein